MEQNKMKPAKPKIPFIYEILLCMFLLIMFQISMRWQYFIYGTFRITERNLVTDIIGITTHILCFIAVMAIGLKIQKRSLISVCYFKKVSGGVWFSLFLCAIGFVLFQFYLEIFFQTLDYGWFIPFDSNENILLTDIIDGAVIPAIAEELMFKGILFFTLRKRFSVIVSVLIVSILFAAVHLNIDRVIPIFIYSCFTFWVYLRTGSIILPMIIHFINNLFSDLINWEVLGQVGTLYAALILFLAGAYMLHMFSKNEKSVEKVKTKDSNL